jgi:hypothetical protein
LESSSGSGVLPSSLCVIEDGQKHHLALVCKKKMGTFRSRFRLAIAVSGIAAAIAVVLYARAVARALPPALGAPVETALDGLSIAAALYVVNWVLAWVYRASWPVTLGRCLVFAVVAYMGVSSLVDVFGENYGLKWQILGLDDAADATLVGALRARAVCYAAVIALAGICIGFGFERRPEDGEPEDDDGVEGDDEDAPDDDRDDR